MRMEQIWPVCGSDTQCLAKQASLLSSDWSLLSTTGLPLSQKGSYPSAPCPPWKDLEAHGVPLIFKIPSADPFPLHPGKETFG